MSGAAPTAGHGHSGARPDHGHAHQHRPAPDADARWLAAAAALIVVFMIGEVIAGVTAHSLALLSDAAHMITDAAAIGLAIITARVAGRPARGGYTYGLRRLEILSAQANGITLVLLAAWLAYEAIRHLLSPRPVTGPLMLGVALAGVVVNLAASWLLARANGASGRRSLNLEGAVAHVLTDLYAFVATAAAAIIILATGFARADAIATLVVVALMLRAGSGLIRESGRIFLEAAPANLDPAALGIQMAAVGHVAEVHDLHIWEITTGMTAASAHVLVEPHQDCHAVRAQLEAMLAREHGITHLTLQVDHIEEQADGRRPAGELATAHDDGPHDDGRHDDGPHDSGHTDGGHTDGGPADSGQRETGQRDTGRTDSGHTTNGHPGNEHTDGGHTDSGHPGNGHTDSEQPGNGRPDERPGTERPEAEHDSHTPFHSHCEDSHGPAYRPAQP